MTAHIHQAGSLFEVDERHPMFTYRPNPLKQRHRDKTLVCLAVNLQRFDEHDVKDRDIVRFSKNVWNLVSVSNATEQTTGEAWLAGAIVLERIRTVRALARRLDSIEANARPLRPMDKETVRRSINVITDLCERLVQAIEEAR